MFFEGLYQNNKFQWHGDRPLSRHKYGAEITTKNFRGFKPAKEWHFSKVAFIDGGNAPIFENSAKALHTCKIAMVFYDNANKLESVIIKNFFVKTIASSDFIIEFYPEILKSVKLPLNSEVLLSSGSFVSPSMGCNIGRRLLELYFANHMISKNLTDVVVMDGSLDFKTIPEKEFIKMFESQLIVAVAKQSKIFTSKGYDFSVLLQHLASMQSLNHWIYYPVFDNEQYSKIMFASFQNNKALRFDVSTKAFQELDEIINFLSFQSNDLLLQGYPIGLARAHSLAVIKNNDINNARGKLIAKAVNKGDNKLRLLHTLNIRSLL